MTGSPACPVCGSQSVAEVLQIGRPVPIFCNVLLRSRADAVDAPVGRIQLGFCDNCEHLFNLSFSPELLRYTEDYENSLHFSGHFDAYCRHLAKRLVESHDVRGQTVVEIGCGKGDFLRMLCEEGGNRGIGFDPSCPHGEQDAAIDFIPDLYSEKYGEYRADLVCCRHVLEHLYEPREFVSLLRRTLASRPGTTVFFEVPNAAFVVDDLSIWDIIYEHYSYFSKSSLRRLFDQGGFAVGALSEEFHGQFLCIESHCDGIDKVRSQRTSPEESVADAVLSLSECFDAIVAEWERRIEERHRKAERGVVWGAGSKGVMFVNMLAGGAEIEYLVDINPRKQGRYIPSTGQKVVPPDFLKTYRPGYVVLMNPAYEAEVSDTLRSIGVECPVLSVTER